MIEVTLAGAELEGFAIVAPASSVRLLLPVDGSLVFPEWNGNEFLLPDGGRPPIRTVTPLRFDPMSLSLALEVVLHDGGRLSAWALGSTVGEEAALSGPGRGTIIDPEAGEWLIAGDETAIPAMSQVIAALPAAAQAHVFIEIVDPDARHSLPERPAVGVEWLVREPNSPPGTALLDAVRGAAIGEDAHVWAAGEAASMQQIRRHVFDDRGITRNRTTIRGYWKDGRAGS